MGVTMLLKRNSIHSATVIKLNQSFSVDALKAGSEKLIFKECKPAQEKTWGFISANDEIVKDLIFSHGDHHLITIREDVKIPKRSLVARNSQKMIKEKEVSIKRKLTKPEREEIRTHVKQSLFPVTPTKEKVTQAIYIETKKLLICVDNNLPQVEVMVDKINQSIKSQSIQMNFKASDMKDELSDTLTTFALKPDVIPKEYDFEVGKKLILKKEKTKASLYEQECDSEEVRVHLMNDKRVESIELIYKEDLPFILSSKRTLSHINLKKMVGVEARANLEEEKSDIFAYARGTFILNVNIFLELWAAVEKVPNEL